MGLFDEITCKYPLPDPVVQDEIFQTKSFDPIMDRYTITEDGRLILHSVRYESVPEEERPYYGTPEWDKPLGQLIGFMRSVPTGDVEIPYHGDIVFYTSIGSHEEGTFEWFEYKARFTEGRLQWIKRLESEWDVGVHSSRRGEHDANY